MEAQDPVAGSPRTPCLGVNLWGPEIMVGSPDCDRRPGRSMAGHSISYEVGSGQGAHQPATGTPEQRFRFASDPFTIAKSLLRLGHSLLLPCRID
jgi:hypothetical protein